MRVRDVAAQAAAQARCELELGARDEDLGVGEVVQAAGVVGVQMGHHQPAHIARADAEPLELRADLLLGLDPLAESADARMPAWEVARLGSAGGLARVDDDHAFRVLDREGVDRQRLRPLAVANRVQQAPLAVADALTPGGRDRDGACLDCVDLHHECSFAGSSGLGAARLVRCEAAQDQLGHAFGELFVDRAAGDQQPVEERPAEHVEDELEIDIGAQVAAIDAAL